MANSSISVRTDAKVKAQAQAILADLGLDMSTAINLFLRQITYRQGIPFEIKKPRTNHVQLGGWEDKIKIADDFDAPPGDSTS